MAGMVPEPEVMYFVPASLDPLVFGYTWRIWARSTSFYLTPRSAAVGGLKISLHGPDDRPDLGMPGFKMGIDRQLMSRAEDLGIGIVNGLRGGALNGWFSGHQLRDGSAWHVLTLRWTWDLFQPGVPSAPVPERPRAGAVALRLMAPTELLRVVDVELFVGNEAPYFPDDEVDARRRNALLPTLRNDAGQFLTGVCRHRTSLAPLAPRQAFTRPPYGTHDRTRGIGFAADEDGVAWIVEQWMPRSIFD